MEYYIQNKSAGFLGNAIIFWAKERRGYTSNLDNSHKFSEDEAKKICLENPEKNAAWPVDYIDNNKGVQRVVDSQYLSPGNIQNFTQ